MQTYLTKSTGAVLLVLGLSMSTMSGPLSAHELLEAPHHAAHATHATQIDNLDQVVERLRLYRRQGDDTVLQSVGRFFELQEAMGDPRTRILYAWYLQSLHRFDEAQGALMPLLDHGYGSPEVMLFSANLARISGNFEAAQSACRQVLSKQPVMGQLCLAQVQLGGSQPPTAELLDRLTSLLGYLPEDPGYRAWAHATLADLARVAGDDSLGLSQSMAAWQLEPTVQNYVALANAYLAIGQADRALELLAHYDSQAPAIVLVRLSAHMQLGTLSSQRTLIERSHGHFRDLIEHNDFLHAREMTQFYLDVRPDNALAQQLAMQNWRLQKEPEDRVLLNRALAL